MQCARVLMVLAVLIGLPTDTEAQHTFDLDVAPARSSFWKLGEIDAATQLNVEFEIRELRRDSRWAPTFQFVLAGESRSVAILLVQEGGKGPITTRIRFSNQDRVIGERPLADWIVDKGKRVKLLLDWSQPGSLSVVADGIDRGA